MAALRYAVQSFAAHGLPTTAQGDGDGDGDGAREAMRLRPLIAHHLGEIDASRGRGVDEGRRRMLPLRVALRRTASGTQRNSTTLWSRRPRLLRDAPHRPTPGRLPPVAERNARQAIVDSLLASGDAFDSVRPTVRVEPQVRTCGPDETDRLDPATRRRCVPIQDYACVAVVDGPPSATTPSRTLKCAGRASSAPARRCCAPLRGRAPRRAPLGRGGWPTISSTLRGASRRPWSPTCRRASSATSSSAASRPAAVAARAPRSPAAVPLEAARAPRFSRGVPRRLHQERLRLHVLAMSPPGRPAVRARRRVRLAPPVRARPQPLTLYLQVHPTSRPASARRTTCRPLRNGPRRRPGRRGPVFSTTPTSCSRCRCAASSPTARGCARAASAATMESSPASAAPTSRSTSSAATTRSTRRARVPRPPLPVEAARHAALRGRSSRILVGAAGRERARWRRRRRRRGPRDERPTARVNDAEGALRAQLGAVERARAAAGPDAGPTDADLLRLDDVAMQHLAAGSLARVELRTDRSGRRLGTVVDGATPGVDRARRLGSTTATSSQRRGAGSTPARSAPTTRAAPAPAPPVAAPAATIARAWAPTPTSTTTATSTSTTR